MAHESTMLPLGTAAPDFALPEVTSGNVVRRDDFADQPVLLVMFLCNHCPYVKHVADELAALGRDYAGSDVAIVAITSNDVGTYPDDSPKATAAEAAARGYVFPYLYDETQAVAKAYTAACTPDFFLFGPDRALRYRGRLDGSRPNTDLPVTGEELRAAIEAVRSGGEPAEQQWPSMGCNIKWRPGNEPPYFG
jgi:peroxiredoxin